MARASSLICCSSSSIAALPKATRSTRGPTAREAALAPRGETRALYSITSWYAPSTGGLSRALSREPDGRRADHTAGEALSVCVRPRGRAAHTPAPLRVEVTAPAARAAFLAGTFAEIGATTHMDVALARADRDGRRRRCDSRCEVLAVVRKGKWAGFVSVRARVPTDRRDGGLVRGGGRFEVTVIFRAPPAGAPPPPCPPPGSEGWRYINFDVSRCIDTSSP